MVRGQNYESLNYRFLNFDSTPARNFGKAVISSQFLAKSTTGYRRRLLADKANLFAREYPVFCEVTVVYR